MKTDKQVNHSQIASNSRSVLVREKQRNSGSDNSADIDNRKTNTYWKGFCTWYVAEKRPDIPNSWGNANRWFASAQRDGWQTSDEPKPGAIIITSESWFGHVAYVESVDGDQISISEMNKHGWNRITTRALDKNDKIIRGYIY